MTEQTTPARYSSRLQQIRDQLDKVINNNQFVNILPALHANDYDFYLESVIKLNGMHHGEIYYRGREVRKIGDNNATK